MKCLAIVLLFALVANVAAIMCYGRPSLIDEYTNMCKTSSSLATITESQSCLTSEIANNDLSCTASSSCAEINIQIASGQFANTDSMMWSAAVCYESSLIVAFCSSGLTIGTTTAAATDGSSTTVASTTTTTAAAVSGSAGTENTATTTEATTTTAATTTGSTTTAASTTTIPTTTTASTTTISTTTAATTTTTTGPTTTTETLPTFTGCITAPATLNSTCTEEQVTVAASHFTDATFVTAASNTPINLTVRNLGCCTDDAVKCRVSDGVTRSNVCLIGDETSTTTVNCENECFGYLTITGSTVTAQFGCITDLDLSGSGFSAVDSCTNEYSGGTCNDASGTTECLRCCSGGSCNSWMTQDSILAAEVVATTGSNAATVIPTAALLICATFISLVY